MSIIDEADNLVGGRIVAFEDDDYQSATLTLEDGRQVEFSTCSCCGLSCEVTALEAKP